MHVSSPIRVTERALVEVAPVSMVKPIPRRRVRAAVAAMPMRMTGLSSCRAAPLGVILISIWGVTSGR